MKEKLARNIIIYRKERGLTQEELATRLGISFQAVSKWENAVTMPDLSLVPELCRTLEVSVDKLLGYVSQDKPITIYEEEYKTENYYWGTEPNSGVYEVLKAMPPSRRLKLLDIGCGEGRDAVFFARNGYEVTGIDVSDAGIAKTKRLAEYAGVQVNVLKADVLDSVSTSHTTSFIPAAFFITSSRSSARRYSRTTSSSLTPAESMS